MGQCFRKMSVGDEMQMKQWPPWSDLPPKLASNIAERLGPIELLSFQSVCKAWNSASSTASAKIESTPDFEPWFLLYDEDSDHKCQLVTETGKKFTMRLPELDGTTCLASNQGWLLLFKKQGLEGEAVRNCGGASSMFFFQPFSKTKIDLPGCPLSELSDHVAAFSCAPTSWACEVCVINRINDYELKLHLLRRGDKEWFQHDIPCSGIDTIKCAAYRTDEQEFYFFDNRDRLFIVFTDHNLVGWRFSRWSPVDPTGPQPKFFVSKSYFMNTDMKKKLGLAMANHEDVSFSTCGTQRKSGGKDSFVYNESISSNRIEESKSRQLKGVWIYPKFYRVPPKEETW
ncbi:unnamed protein product [Prunus armeniaca]|uniref:F-box domain-containing protein n=2 Tax=Prunus armeniaca TaxID=36596 RepID=A0A6J5XHB2_PRUAR|nr:hypothetical protein GBA52_028220 [Prunus armeniaca]CAB4311967.1 unnamed protein product [Prunus armeniaca]